MRRTDPIDLDASRTNGRSMSDILLAADKQATALVTTQQPSPPRDELREVGAYLYYISYLDLMKMSRRMLELKGDKPVSTPEEMAALLSAWAVDYVIPKTEGTEQ